MHGLFCELFFHLHYGWSSKLCGVFMFWSYSSLTAPSSLGLPSQSFTAGLLHPLAWVVSPDLWGPIVFFFSLLLPKPHLSLTVNSNRKLDKYVPIFLTRSLHTRMETFLWLGDPFYHTTTSPVFIVLSS